MFIHSPDKEILLIKLLNVTVYQKRQFPIKLAAWKNKSKRIQI